MYYRGNSLSAREVSIAANPTDSEPHHPHADDAQASLRAELLGQLVSAQFELETALADLMRGGGVEQSVIAGVRGQLGSLGALRQQVAGADAKTLATMRAGIASAVASGQSAVQQAQGERDNANVSTLLNYAQNARAAVNDVMRGMKDFEQDLRFANAQDEAEYRRREEERRAYIAREQAKGTPQGDLNASGAAVGQMADAAAHGAANSPEFQQRWNALVDSTAKLRAQIVRDGGDVSEFDTRLREDLRRIMKAKGVPDAQIDALFAAHPGDPLEAAKAFVAEQKGGIGEKEIGDLSRKAQEYKDSAETSRMAAPPLAPAPVANVPASAVDAMANLKTLGVIAGEHDATNPPVHGVSVAALSVPNASIGTRS